MLKRSSNSAQRRAPPSGMKFRRETPGTDSHKCVSCLILFRDVSWLDASMADLVWMTKGNENIYVCVRQLWLGKNAKQKSVRNGTTVLSLSFQHISNSNDFLSLSLSFCFQSKQKVGTLIMLLIPVRTSGTLEILKETGSTGSTLRTMETLWKYIVTWLLTEVRCRWNK